MRKRIAAAFLTACLLGALLPARAGAAELTLKAPSAVLMDAATGAVLYESNGRERLRRASVTKIMTLLLVMEALDAGRIGWNDAVTASASAVAKGGSQVYLREGEQMTVDEMLKSVVVSSANDCAAALAEHVAGSESAFVGRMNERAAELGMKDTRFVNCTGLDDAPDAAEHLTTAYDIALMSRELLRHDAIRKYTTIWMDTVRDGKFGLSNTNKLVRFYNGTTGLKTGYTSAAGYCMSATAKRDGMELIAVVMHCATSPDRFESAKALLDYGFANYALVTPTPPEKLDAVRVELGASPSVQPELGPSGPILLAKGLKNSVKTEVELRKSVAAPVEKGQKLGTMTVKAGERVLASVPIVSPARVERLTWRQLAAGIVRRMCLCA